MKMISMYELAIILLSEVDEQMLNANLLVDSVQFSSVAQSCLTLSDPMNRSTQGLPVHH